jgi:hypothetical protein
VGVKKRFTRYHVDMGLPRRTVLIWAAVTLAGCSGVTTGGSDPETDTGASDTTEVTEQAATQTPASTDACDLAAVTRPAVPTDTAVAGRSYPQPPASVGEFLTAFELAFARNQALETFSEVTHLEVRTLTAFEPETVENGVHATARLRVFVVRETADGGRRTERADHVASYFLGDDGLYRVETAERDGTVDPQTEPERRLVACADAETE